MSGAGGKEMSDERDRLAAEAAALQDKLNHTLDLLAECGVDTISVIGPQSREGMYPPLTRVSLCLNYKVAS